MYPEPRTRSLDGPGTCKSRILCTGLGFVGAQGLGLDRDRVIIGSLVLTT